ncbi:MAG: DUF4160 domain-containing protein [Bryobacteraceae bacterium]
MEYRSRCFSTIIPRHFHARYGEFEAKIDIAALSVVEGHLPRRALNLVREWAIMHREELHDTWRLRRENAQPAKIDPLL